MLVEKDLSMIDETKPKIVHKEKNGDGWRMK